MGFNKLQDLVKGCRIHHIKCRSSDAYTSKTKEFRGPRGFEKWLCRVSCFNVSGICTTDPEIPPCSKCPCSGLCVSCRVPEFTCGFCSNTGRLNKSKSCWDCCIPKFPSCTTCSCSSIKCMYPKCVEVNLCSCYKTAATLATLAIKVH